MLEVTENQSFGVRISKTKEGPHKCDPSCRGPEQIRTAVEAFAELCLATRPQDLFLTTANIGDLFIRNCK